jgi:hypothetical protein
MQSEVELLEQKVNELTSELDNAKTADTARVPKEVYDRLQDDFAHKCSEADQFEKEGLKYQTLLDEKIKDYEKLKKDYETVFKDLVILKEREH